MALFSPCFTAKSFRSQCLRVDFASGLSAIHNMEISSNRLCLPVKQMRVIYIYNYIYMYIIYIYTHHTRIYFSIHIYSFMFVILHRLRHVVAGRDLLSFPVARLRYTKGLMGRVDVGSKYLLVI